MNKTNLFFKFTFLIVGVFIGISLSYYIPNILLYQPASYSLFLILILSVLFILIIYVLVIRLKVAKNLFILLLIIYITSTSAFAYTFYSTDLTTAPNLINKSSNDAKQILTDQGLTANISYSVINDSQQQNIVLSQNPPNYALIPKNSKINITIGIPPTEISITKPENGDTVTQLNQITGLVKNLQPNDKVYVLIQPQPRGDDGPYRWYIQPTPYNPINITVKNGTWKCDGYFGSQGDQGRVFKIVAIVTDQTFEKSPGFRLPSYKFISDPAYVTLT